MRRRVAAAAAALAVALTGTALTAASAAPPDADVSALAAGFDFTRPDVVATGLEVPWGMAFLPDGSALVAERMRARIVQVRPGVAPVQVATVPNVAPTGEGGLLGIALSPTYAQDNLVYAYLTSATDNRIVRFTLANPQSQQVVVSGIPRGSIHDGGRIAFGPDGMLYAGAGEAGQNTWDEINLIVAGGNYGWPTVEGIANNPNSRDPLVVWRTSEASSVRTVTCG